MRIGSLFSGIGGLELGLEHAHLGPTLFQIELDPFCRTVLARWWPHVDRKVCDVREANKSNLAPVDLLCGGFPCQDVSVAGEGRGLAGARSGLWGEFARVTEQLQPRWVVVENVAHGRGRWLCQVRHDLQTLGYRSAAVLLSAKDVGAPHNRARVFVVAHADSKPLWVDEQRTPAGQSRGLRDEGNAELGHAGVSGGGTAQPSMGRSVDGFSGRLEWPSGPREDRRPWEPEFIIPKTNRTRLKALGNAVVPRCAEVIGHMIRNVEHQVESWEDVFEGRAK